MRVPTSGRVWRGRERSRGQALVEFALVAPLLFIAILGIIEAGRFIFHYEVMNHATREGARYAIVHGADSTCPSGPPPFGTENPCDPAGDNVKAAVQEAALDLAGLGDLFVHEPVWTSRATPGNPSPVAGDRVEDSCSVVTTLDD